MAWTNLSFAYGSVLTSAKMTQMYDNFAYGAGSTTPAFQAGTTAATPAYGTTDTSLINAAFVNAGVTASNTEVLGALGSGATTSLTYVEACNYRILQAGTYRVAKSIQISNAAGTAYGKIYKNGVALGAEATTSSTTAVTTTEDFTFAIGDTVQLFIHTNNASYTASGYERFRGSSCSAPPAFLTIGER